MVLLFVFGLCHVLPGMCYVLCVAWCGGDSCVVRGGPISCASSPAELWPLSNLYLVEFSMVLAVHIIHST